LNSENCEVEGVNLKEFLNDFDVPKLNTLESDSLEREISLKEAAVTLNVFGNN